MLIGRKAFCLRAEGKGEAAKVRREGEESDIRAFVMGRNDAGTAREDELEAVHGGARWVLQACARFLSELRDMLRPVYEEEDV